MEKINLRGQNLSSDADFPRQLVMYRRKKLSSSTIIFIEIWLENLYRQRFSVVEVEIFPSKDFKSLREYFVEIWSRFDKRFT